MHICCRNSLYPRSNVQRFPVPDEYVPWSVEYKNYKPEFYESQSLTGTEWADPHSADPNFEPKFNVLDGLINRKSHVGKYEVIDKMPRNIFGRTGIIGRGLLGRFGVNHAADPIVSLDKLKHQLNMNCQLFYVRYQHGNEMKIPKLYLLMIINQF